MKVTVVGSHLCEDTRNALAILKEKNIEVEFFNLSEDLSALTLSELKDRAKDAGVKGYSAMKKQDLVEALTK